jgi:glycosyltransferase involved in cell wall biosynthesis
VTAAFKLERDEQVTPTVSVALCTFNGERFIAEQIASIFAQTRLPQELIVSDDGSTDATLELITAEVARLGAAAGSARVTLRILHNPVPLGVVRNFQQAVSATTGDFVVLCDQDDRWATDRIERALDAFAANPGLLLLHADANLIDAADNPLGDTLFGALAMTARERELIASGHALVALLGRNLVTGATTMFRRSLLQPALPFPSSWVHDEWLAAVAAATGRMDFLPDRLIDYRQHGGNAIGAGRIGFSGRLAKLREPREERNRALVDRAAALVDRLTEIGSAVPAENLELARGKLAHERARLGLPPGRLRRVGPVVRELRSGGYFAFGRGTQDALRDLVQPAR